MQEGSTRRQVEKPRAGGIIGSVDNFFEKIFKDTRNKDTRDKQIIKFKFPMSNQVQKLNFKY